MNETELQELIDWLNEVKEKAREDARMQSDSYRTGLKNGYVDAIGDVLSKITEITRKK